MGTTVTIDKSYFETLLRRYVNSVPTAHLIKCYLPLTMAQC